MEGYRFGSPIGFNPSNDPPVTYIHSNNIRIADPITLGVPRLIEAMMYITVDLEFTSYPWVILTFLGEYEVPEVSVPSLDLPALLFPLGFLKEISGMSNLPMDLVHATFLATMLGLTPPISSLPYSSASVGLLITPCLIPSFAPPDTTMQVPVPSFPQPMPYLQTSLPEKVAIPTAQTISMFGMVPPATLPYVVALQDVRLSATAALICVIILVELASR